MKNNSVIQGDNAPVPGARALQPAGGRGLQPGVCRAQRRRNEGAQEQDSHGATGGKWSLS